MEIPEAPIIQIKIKKVEHMRIRYFDLKGTITDELDIEFPIEFVGMPFVFEARGRFYKRKFSNRNINIGRIGYLVAKIRKWFRSRYFLLRHTWKVSVINTWINKTFR